MFLNINKIKYMILLKKQIMKERLFSMSQQIEKVQKYNCLGVLVNKDWNHSKETKCIMGMARGAFRKISKVYNCLLGTKNILLRRYCIFPILLYGTEI